MLKNRLHTGSKFSLRSLFSQRWMLPLVGALTLTAIIFVLQPDRPDPPVYQIRKTPDPAYQQRTRALTPAGQRIGAAEQELFQLRGIKYPSLQQQSRMQSLERLIALLKRAEDLELRIQWAEGDPAQERAPLQQSLDMVYAEINRLP